MRSTFTSEPYSRDLPKQADLKEPIEGLPRDRLDSDFGCVAYPDRLGQLVANVVAGSEGSVRELVNEQKLNIVTVVDREPDELFSDSERRKRRAELVETSPADDTVDIPDGPNTDRCPALPISVDPQGLQAQVDHPRMGGRAAVGGRE